ncbi:hypothetical protein J7384_18845 [Endozoicomonas sp. G2_1]|uniref:hypothetical protein n=1 Tax=Endozoicomonas sp. G2_1 TaxID=2821091 RepID=UPI001ADC5F3D|nr:hypothetical protein [Endozoicomonas sp. G2_1]MBO9492427.1 hypothetical protein [Endozoicomonas sp. G2_1]
MTELTIFDIWLYFIIGIAMSLGGFFLFHYYNIWAKRQLSNADSSLIRSTALVWFVGFGISLTGIGITYIFGTVLFSSYFS